MLRYVHAVLFILVSVLSFQTCLSENAVDTYPKFAVGTVALDDDLSPSADDKTSTGLRSTCSATRISYCEWECSKTILNGCHVSGCTGGYCTCRRVACPDNSYNSR